MTHAFAWTGMMMGNISNKNKGKADENFHLSGSRAATYRLQHWCCAASLWHCRENTGNVRGKNIFILDEYIHKYKISFLTGMATLHVLHIFILPNILCLTLSKVFWRLQLSRADNGEPQRSNRAQSKEPIRSNVQEKINNTVGSQWAFCGPFLT